MFDQPTRAAFSREPPPLTVAPKRSAGDNYRHALATGKVKPKPDRRRVAIGNSFYAPKGELPSC
jgi:hypothetical protein